MLNNLKPLVENNILWRKDGEKEDLVILASCNGGPIRFLNPIGSLILELSNGKNTVEVIIEQIIENYDCKDKKIVERDVEIFLQALRENEIINF